MFVFGEKGGTFRPETGGWRGILPEVMFFLWLGWGGWKFVCVERWEEGGRDDGLMSVPPGRNTIPYVHASCLVPCFLCVDWTGCLGLGRGFRRGSVLACACQREDLYGGRGWWCRCFGEFACAVCCREGRTFASPERAGGVGILLIPRVSDGWSKDRTNLMCCRSRSGLVRDGNRPNGQGAGISRARMSLPGAFFGSSIVAAHMHATTLDVQAAYL